MNPRLRRLRADEVMLRETLAAHPHITVTAGPGNPPTAYTVVYDGVPGVTIAEGSTQPQYSMSHRATVNLVAGYPRDKPYCTIDTPLFHPNFGPRAGDEICIGDYWSAGQTIVDIIVKIGQMIQYQAFNVRSPLNAVAAKWSAQHPDVVPVGDIDLWRGCGAGGSDALTAATAIAAPKLPETEPVRADGPIDLTGLT